MTNIIVAFPKPETAKNVKKALMQNGFHVDAVCLTGAQALQSANELDGGIIVSSYRFPDMMYTELHDYLPSGFEMLLVAPPDKCSEREMPDIVCISVPFKIGELLHTVEMMEYTIARRKKRERAKPKVRSKEEEMWIARAKELLMSRNNMTEDEAHHYIQERSMDNGTGLVETAQMILSLMK